MGSVCLDATLFFTTLVRGWTQRGLPTGQDRSHAWSPQVCYSSKVKHVRVSKQQLGLFEKQLISIHTQQQRFIWPIENVVISLNELSFEKARVVCYW